MRICIQSGTPLSQSALYKPYHDSLLRHAQRVASPGTTVEFPNLGKQYPGAARSRTHLHLVQHETIKSALRAQEEGYDVFVTQCLDLGYHELREMGQQLEAAFRAVGLDYEAPAPAVPVAAPSLEAPPLLLWQRQRWAQWRGRR